MTLLNGTHEPPAACYFMVADVLGFSNIIKNLPSAEQNDRVNNWIQIVESVKAEVEVEKTQLISDTLFAMEEDSEKGLGRMLKFARLLTDRCIGNSLPIRGAVVHGDASWGTLTYGQAVIEAHVMERSLEWIGISCSPNLPRSDKFWDWDSLVVYPVPRKGGPVQLLPAMVWDVPKVETLFSQVTKDGLFARGDHIPWEVVSKIERTVQFGMYLRRGKHRHLDPRHYQGWFPMHYLEPLLEVTEP